jgi:hypothetical protein
MAKQIQWVANLSVTGSFIDCQAIMMIVHNTQAMLQLKMSLCKMRNRDIIIYRTIIQF